jgi:hypothetical protein
VGLLAAFAIVVVIDKIAERSRPGGRRADRATTV